ncbi:MAG: alpha/beta fold hydrolase, partial [Phycisphaerae bacterium]
TFRPLGAPFDAPFAATIDEDGVASGKVDQMGQEFPFRMERVSAEEARAVGPERPQTPRPPFPYDIRDVGYENTTDGTRLAGTLTTPKDSGPHPAVILITGSGPQDRDETLLGHKPFAVIADHLTRRGIAVLRVDDRGVGGSSGDILKATAEDFAADVIAGLAFLKSQSRIDARRIGLLGHSEGGSVAPLVAARRDDVAFIVLLAGTGLPGGDILAMQLERILSASGASRKRIRDQLDVQGRIIDLVRREADEIALREPVMELIRLQTAVGAGGTPPSPAALDAMLKPQLMQMTSPWFRSFVRVDPREALRKVRCPVLALNGELDLQVPAAENLTEIKKALAAAGNSDVTVRALAELNHLFQHAATGVPGEYAVIAETIDPGVLDEVANWIRARTILDK